MSYVDTPEKIYYERLRHKKLLFQGCNFRMQQFYEANFFPSSGQLLKIILRILPNIDLFH